MLKLTGSLLPDRIRHIPQPPKQLFTTGETLDVLLKSKSVAIVGSRTISPYGKQVTSLLARQLAEKGIVTISGLALGVDACAHQAALDAGGKCIAVLPSPIDNILPRSNMHLANDILKGRGALVSEYASGSESFKGNFIERNRLMSGLADVVLIPEAAKHSGTLHTAAFALDQGKEVLVVPGSIFSKTSEGTHALLKLGATPVTCVADVLHALGIDEKQQKLLAQQSADPSEQAILDLLILGLSDGEQLRRTSGLDTSLFNKALSMLEITGKIQHLGANQWGLHA